MNNEAPLFSVIIPTYNRSKLLQEAIQSVLDQTFNNWECIIIDDGSIDDTRGMVQSFEDPRIKYFYQNHSERSTARNYGITEAYGMYVCFLDDDDLFLSQHLRILSEHIASHGFREGVFRTNMKLSRNGDLKEWKKAPEDLDNPVRYFLTNMAGIHTLCFHKAILHRFKFDARWRHFQDTHLLIRALTQFPIITIPDYTVIYNIHDESWSQKVFKTDEIEERLNNNLEAMVDLFSYYGVKDLAGNKMLKTLKSRKHLDYASGCIHSGRFKLAGKLILNAVKVYPGILLDLYFYKVLFQAFRIK